MRDNRGLPHTHRMVVHVASSYCPDPCRAPTERHMLGAKFSDSFADEGNYFCYFVVKQYQLTKTLHIQSVSKIFYCWCLYGSTAVKLSKSLCYIHTGPQAISSIAATLRLKVEEYSLFDDHGYLRIFF